MGYKTFEDMKHNIPEGATHYRNECESFLFTWFKETDIGIKFYEEVSQNWRFIGRHVNNLKSKMVKIPSQIETPEEKEALDMIDTTSKQVESLAKGDVVEWKNGDECIYNGELYVYQCVASWDSDACILSGKSRNSHSLTDAWIEELSKPEPKEQKAERERDACIHVMVDDFNVQDIDYNYRGKVAKVCAALYDAGYRKESK